jgi:hypothetical protein
MSVGLFPFNEVEKHQNKNQINPFYSIYPSRGRAEQSRA